MIDILLIYHSHLPPNDLSKYKKTIISQKDRFFQPFRDFRYNNNGSEGKNGVRMTVHRKNEETVSEVRER